MVMRLWSLPSPRIALPRCSTAYYSSVIHSGCCCRRCEGLGIHLQGNTPTSVEEAAAGPRSPSTPYYPAPLTWCALESTAYYTAVIPPEQ
jgi:hypothetical protein